MSDTSTTATRHSWDGAPMDHPAPLATRQLVKGDLAMVARFVLEEGFDIVPHVHHNEQITVIVEGTVVCRVADVGSDDFREETLGAGEVMVLPPYAPHAFRALERTVVFDIFSPPSDKTGIDQG